MKHQLVLSDLSDLKALFMRKVGKIKAKALMSDYDYLCSFGNYTDYKEAVNSQESNSK